MLKALFFWKNNSRGTYEVASSRKRSSVRKRQSSREERLRAQRYKKIFAVISVTLIVMGGCFAGHYTGAFEKMRVYTKAETMRISSEAGFRVNEILVAGRQEIAKEELLETLTIKKDMPIFWLDINAAQQELMKISWVKNVTISRRLPSSIFVDLEEREPAALWQHDKQVDLVDRDGIILVTNNMEKWKDLPLIVGTGSVENLPQLADLLNAEPLVKNHIVSATRIGERRWDLQFDTGVVVKLPEEDVEFAIRRLVKVETEKQILSKNVKIIDLRKPERMVLELAKPGEDVPLNKGGQNKG